MQALSTPTPTYEKRIIGDCTLYRGDSLELLRAGVFDAVDVVLTDPPYEMTVQVKSNSSPKGTRVFKFDWDTKGVTENHVLPVLQHCSAMARYTVLSFCGVEQIGGICATMRKQGLTAKHAAWVKPYPPPPAPGNWWPSSFEAIVYGFNRNAPFFDTNPGRCNVFIVDSLRYGRAEKVGHPNQKPIELVSYLMGSITPPASVVADPYMGSGSTAIAALSLGHSFVGCEIDPGATLTWRADASRPFTNPKINSARHDPRC